MKISVFFKILFVTSLASAYTFKEDNKPIASSHILKEATKIGLSNSEDEVQAKQEIRAWNQKTLKRHTVDEAVPAALVNEAQIRSENLEQAKVIARHQLFRAVEKHWYRIKDSSFNEPAVDSFFSFAPYLKRELDKIEYIPTRDPKGYMFSLPWADVRVDKKLKKVSWVIRIGSHLDGNRLQEGAEKIQIPDRSAE